MLFQIGEITKRTGLTVRALHHYEEIGLLIPASRTSSGYRLYNLNCIERLARIQILRQIGFTLKDICDILDDESSNIEYLLEKQIDILAEKIMQTSALYHQLEQFKQLMLDGNILNQTDWFSILKMLSVYDKYFSHQELKQLPLYMTGTLKSDAWQERITTVNILMEKGKMPQSTKVQKISAQWMIALEQDTGQNPDFLVRLNKMLLVDNDFVHSTGITEKMIKFITHGFSEYQLSLFRPYLSLEQLAFVRQNYFIAVKIWPELIAGLYNALKLDLPPGDPTVQKLAQSWLNMFNQFTGGEVELQMAIRKIYQSEPKMSQGTWMTPEIKQYLFSAVSIILANS